MKSGSPNHETAHQEQPSVHDHVSVHEKSRILTDIDRMTILLRLSLPLSTDFGNANFSTQGQSPLMADLMRLRDPEPGHSALEYLCLRDFCEKVLERREFPSRGRA